MEYGGKMIWEPPSSGDYIRLLKYVDSLKKKVERFEKKIKQFDRSQKNENPPRTRYQNRKSQRLHLHKVFRSK